MISKSTIKLIKSLAIKKYRVKENLFLVEGDKNILEVLNSEYKTEVLFATKTFIAANRSSCKKAKNITEVDPAEIKKASLLQNPQNCLALCELLQNRELPKNLTENLSIYLDDIQDPGNLGTIIRICDWFGIENLFCSLNTVDFYNPKVIQASMGSFCRVNLFKTNFDHIEKLAAISGTPIFGAFLEGDNIYTTTLPQKAILVMGNEGNGIRKELEKKITQKIKIPDFSGNSEGAESLNVSVATAIICSEFKRRSI
jgi:TrmH family RNA methyltransferase